MKRKIQGNFESTSVGTPVFSFIFEKILGFDGLFLAGEALKDIVITMVVISIIIKYSLLQHLGNPIAIFFISMAIMLVAMNTAAKWLDVIFSEDDKTKEKSK